MIDLNQLRNDLKLYSIKPNIRTLWFYSGSEGPRGLPGIQGERGLPGKL